jgi:N-acylneuraminate cytidylyltransferase
VLLLEPTSPGRLPEDVARAFALLESDDQADGVVACSQPSFNPFYVGVVDRQGYLAPAFPAASHTRRQEVPSFYRVNGALYLWRSEFLRRAPAAWLPAGRHCLLEIPEVRAFSIDDALEFEMAELMIRHRLVELPWLGDQKG